MKAFEKNRTLKLATLIIFGVLLIDQSVKIWIKTHMKIGDEFSVMGDWFMIHFIENNGMAYGLELGGEIGKLILSSFRIVAVIVGGYWLVNLCKKVETPFGLIFSVSLILAGALGNIFDSAIYGLIFTESYTHIAQFLPDGGGYAGFLHGKVVDMLYFPILEGRFPSWVPLWGNDSFMFFRPVFNIADSSITVGIGLIILFQKKFFVEEAEQAEDISDAERAL